MPRAAAQQQGLVWVNDKGHFGTSRRTFIQSWDSCALLGLSVDSKYTYSGDGRRPSARITSKQSFRHGLLILDAVHLPYGEGTWPAFWINGADGKWPYSGELDVIEGIGNNVKNSVSYHTGPNVCFYDLSKKQKGIFNRARGTDCYALANNNEACGNVDPSTTSYGSGASRVGGGVWALEWTSGHIKVGFSLNQRVPAFDRVAQRLGTSLERIYRMISQMANPTRKAGGRPSLIFPPAIAISTRLLVPSLSSSIVSFFDLPTVPS